MFEIRYQWQFCVPNIKENTIFSFYFSSFGAFNQIGIFLELINSMSNSCAKNSFCQELNSLILKLYINILVISSELLQKICGQKCFFPLLAFIWSLSTKCVQGGSHICGSSENKNGMILKWFEKEETSKIKNGNILAEKFALFLRLPKIDVVTHGEAKNK